MTCACPNWSRTSHVRLAAGVARKSVPDCNRLKRMPDRGWRLADIKFSKESLRQESRGCVARFNGIARRR
jgi:hypothetical protein